MANNTASRLLSDCTKLSEDIVYCQKLGRKVLLSIGGIWGPDAEHNYDVTTSANGEYFADFLWNAFGPFEPSWTGPRPFDTVDNGAYTVLDGFDFDLEVQFAATAGYIALLNRLRVYISAYNAIVKDHPVIITGAPLCPLADGWSQVKDLITSSVFDKLWIQFYGNDLCPAGSAGFNYDAWESFVANSTSKGALLYVGLPAVMDVTGYLNAEQAIALADNLKNRASFGGVMVHDAAIARANANTNGGVPLYAVVYEHLIQGGQGPMIASAASSAATADAPANVVTKTESITVALTKTIHGTGLSSLPPFGANSSSAFFGTGTAGTVFVTASCLPSGTVSGTALGDGLPSGTRTSATHSYSYSVTSTGVSTGMARSVMAVTMAAVVSVAVSCLI